MKIPESEKFLNLIEHRRNRTKIVDNRVTQIQHVIHISNLLDYKKGCTRLADTSVKLYQLLAHGRWFSPGTPASSTTKTGRHDIAEKWVF